MKHFPRLHLSFGNGNVRWLLDWSTASKDTALKNKLSTDYAKAWFWICKRSKLPKFMGNPTLTGRHCNILVWKFGTTRQILSQTSTNFSTAEKGVKKIATFWKASFFLKCWLQQFCQRLDSPLKYIWYRW